MHCKNWKGETGVVHHYYTFAVSHCMMCNMLLFWLRAVISVVQLEILAIILGKFWGHDSVVSIATHNGLDGPGIEFQWS